MNNRSVYIVDTCKNSLINTYDDYRSQNSVSFNFNYCLNDRDYQEARIIIMKVYKEQNEEIPDVIKRCRDVREFIYYYGSREYGFDYGHYDALGEISDVFNIVLDYLVEKSVEVKIIKIDCDVPEELTYQHILEDLEKCDKRIEDNDYSGAITSARSLVEGVCKEIILNITNTEIEEKDDLPKLFKKVQKHLNLDASNPKLEQPLKQVISGLSNIVNGLAAIRNSNGDAHSRKYDVSLHHALLVVNSAKTVVTFLFDTYEYQREKGRLKVIAN